MTTLWINTPADLIPPDATLVLGYWKEEVVQNTGGTLLDLFPDYVFALMRTEIDADMLEFTLLCGAPVADGGIEYSGHSSIKVPRAAERNTSSRKHRIRTLLKALTIARKRSEV